MWFDKDAECSVQNNRNNRKLSTPEGGTREDEFTLSVLCNVCVVADITGKSKGVFGLFKVKKTPISNK